MEKVEVVSSYNRLEKMGKTKEEKKINIDKEFIFQFILYGISFMLGRANLIQYISSFGVAFFSASLGKKNKTTSAWIGFFSLLGAFSTGGVMFSVKYALAICLIFVGDILLNLSNKKILIKSAYCSLFSGVIFVTYTFLNGMLIYDTIMSSIEVLLIFVLTYIFNMFLDSIDQKGKYLFTTEDFISIIITVSIILVGLDKVLIMNISIQNVIAMTLIMMIGYYGGGATAAAGGAFLGLILNLSNQVAPIAIGTWAFAGLAGGIFKQFKKLGVASGFVLGWILINGYTGFDEKVIYSALDVVFSLAIFMVMPANLIERWLTAFKPIPKNKKNYSATISPKVVGDKLENFSGAFSVLSDQFVNVNGDESNKMNNERLNAMFDNVAQNVCINCEGYACCWKSDFYNTYKMLFSVIDNAQYKGNIEKKVMPQKFKDRCIKLDFFIKEFNYAFNLYRLNLVWEKKLDETKSIMAKQLKEVAQTIDQMSLFVNTKVEIQILLKEMVQAEFIKNNMKCENIEVYKDKAGILNVNIWHKGCVGRLKCEKDIIPMISKIVGFDMVKEKESCAYDEQSGLCYLRLMQKPKYSMTFSKINVAKNIGGVCGDNVNTFSINSGSTVMVVSDGMGTGIKAFNQSKASVEALESLLKSGFQNETAAKLVNSLLLIGDGADNFATLDICTINLYTGELEFSKIGAAPSYIKRKNRSEYISSDTMPVGVMDDVEVKLTYKHLEDGDMVIMITDGVIDNGDGMWLKRYINEIQTESTEGMVKEIIVAASKNFNDDLVDDMTVLVGKIKKLV